MAVITITSTDLTAGALIPPLHKGSFCGQGNINPQFAWTISGFAAGHIETYEIYMLDLTASGSGPGGKFVHWGVTGIPNTFSQSVAQNQTWTTETVLPSDYGSGDASNGYHGPCAPAATDNNYEIRVIAKIAKQFQAFVGEAEVVGTFRFTDNNQNLASEPTTGDCGTLACPPGSELIGDKCQTIEISEATLNGTIYTANAATPSTGWGWAGTRFYADADTYQLPLRGGQGSGYATDAILEEDDGVGAALPFTLNNTTPVWSSAANQGVDGRLAIAGVWPASNPTQEWIGFSRCIDVPETKKYCIGLAADNRMRFKINGQMIARFDILALTAHFNYWHVIEITLNQGANIVEIEGYNDGSFAGFAAEIYDATLAQLNAVTTLPQLEPYILWSTRDRVGETFDIGEESGYTCPDGTAYDSCNGGQCTSITYSDPEQIQCCVLIENCKDPEETYLIQMLAGQPDIYQDTVYEFATEGQSLLPGKCFKVLGLEVCPEGADYTDVVITTNHGLDNCLACDPSLKVESCDEPGIFQYIALAVGQPALVAGNVYEFSTFTGCYTFVEEVNDTAPVYTDVTITTNHATTYCLICEPCHVFTSCADGVTEIRVRFAEGVEVPLLTGVYELGGDAAIENTCWQYTGTDTCDQGTEDYLNVTITKDYECDDCSVCNPKYLITDCTDSQNTQIIEWDQNEEPLDETQTYVFDFDPDTCYTVEARPPVPCGVTEVTEPPEAPGPKWRTSACVYGMADTLRFVNSMGDETAGSVHTVESLIINGTERTAEIKPTYPMPIAGGEMSWATLNTVAANNQYDLTYTDQVTGLNATFAALGVSDLIKAQVVTNDIWAGTEQVINDLPRAHGGYYLIVADTVNSFQIDINDDEGYIRRYTWDVNDGVSVDKVDGGTPVNPQIMYEYASCVNAAAEPFVVVNGIVQEPAF